MNIQTAKAAARMNLVRLAGLAGQVGLVGLAVSFPVQGAEAVSGRFVANGAEVTDTVTGLVWRRCVEGQRWKGSSCEGSPLKFNWPKALDRARSEASGGIPWRLPNVKELGSLVDDSRANPAIDTAVFPGVYNEIFRTSTHAAGAAWGAWCVHFGDGSVGYTNRNHHFPVRLVRSGQ